MKPSFSHLFRHFSVTMEPHCALKVAKHLFKNKGYYHHNANDRFGLNIAQSPFLIWFGDCFVCMFKPKSFIRLLRANERFGFEEVLLSGKTIRSMTHLRGATVSCLQYNVSSVKSSSNYCPTPTKWIYPYIINVLENKLIQSILVVCFL